MKLIDKYLPADYCDSVFRRINPEDGWQEASVTTVVKFNNFLGRLYFIGIWMFHKLLVKSLFRKAVRV